tara:strand:- start:81 stop:893 length:813 start_codon:yes stop_codon:yes gene_type:complete
MERYYITGASGYIGLRLTDFFSKKNMCYEGFSRNKNNKKLTYINNYKEIPFRDDTAIIHLAQSSYIDKVKNDDEVSILKHLLNKNWSHFIFASSAILYGDKEIYERKEREKIEPTNLYAKNKHKCEKMVIENGGTVLRFSNIYGLKPKQNTVMDSIFKNFQSEKKVCVHENNAIRDFLWIDDAVESIFKSCKYKPNKILNIGTGEATSIKDLYNIINRFTKYKKNTIKIKNGRNKSCIVVNTTEAKKNLKWSYRMSVENGLRNIVSELNL